MKRCHTSMSSTENLRQLRAAGFEGVDAVVRQGVWLRCQKKRPVH